MDITSSGSSSKVSVVSSSVLSAGTVVIKQDSQTPDVPEQKEIQSDASFSDVQVSSAVSESSDASEAVKALTRGLQGVADLFVTSQPSRKQPLREEVSDLAQKLSEQLQSTSSSEPIDEKLKVLAERLSSIFGDEQVKAPAISTKDFILGILTQVSRSTAATESAAKAAAEDDVKSANTEASQVSVQDVDDLVSKLTSSVDKKGLLSAFKTPNVALLT